MKNWERFANRREALEAHKAEGVVFGCGWGEIEWLYMDYIPDEPRIDYLCRLRKRGILKSDGYKELERLRKAAPKLAVTFALGGSSIRSHMAQIFIDIHNRYCARQKEDA